MSFPQDKEMSEVAYRFWNCSEGTQSREDHWAEGPTPDGKGQFKYLADPQPLGEEVTELAQLNARLHSTPKKPMPPMTS
jgi:Mn-containing catalase